MTRASRTTRILFLMISFAAFGCDTLESITDGGVSTDGGSNSGTGSEVEGTIGTNTTWSLRNCPITVVGDVYVNGDGSPKLTIEAGCEVRFRSGKGLYVAYSGAAGAVVAEGTAERPILFTSADAKEPGAWAGISMDEQTADDATRLSFVTVEYAGGPFLSGGLDVDGALPTIVDSTFRNNDEHGIYFTGGGGFGAASARVKATGNTLYGIRIGADAAHTIPANGSYTGNTIAGVEIEGGTVSKSATWRGLDDRYVVSGDVYVNGDASPVLTITEGAQLAFAPDKGLYVAYSGAPGALSVEGTAAAPVTFTANRQPQPGAWSGISFDDSTVDASSQIANAIVEYGGGSFLSGCIEIDTANVTIQNLRVRNCADNGIYLTGGASLGASSAAITASGNELSGIAIEASGASTVPSLGSDYSGNTVGGVNIRGGTVVRSGTWRAINVPYVVSGDVYINGPARPILTLEAGVTLELRADKGLYVAYSGEAGGLTAVGTVASPIVFTAFDQAVKGNWSGISFDDNTIDASSILDHVVVEWAGGAFLSGDVDIEDARPTISNSTIWRSLDCGISASCSTAGQGPTITTIDYGTGADANDGGGLCNNGC